jgi:protein required for attachment to host cells
MRMLKFSFAAAMTAACLVFEPAANGQTQAPASPEQASPEQTPNLSDQKLDQMAAAVKQVATVKQDYQQRIATAAPSDKQRLAEEAGDALEKAVTDHGLSVEEFNSIIVVAQNDPGVLEKLRQRLRPPK